MNPTRIPFPQMKLTVNLLRAASLAIIGTLKAENLDKDQTKLVTMIVVANDMTTKQLKHNPTRKQMLTLCGTWDRLADQAQGLLLEDQAELRDKLKAALAEAAWVKELNPNMKLSEV